MNDVQAQRLTDDLPPLLKRRLLTALADLCNYFDVDGLLALHEFRLRWGSPAGVRYSGLVYFGRTNLGNEALIDLVLDSIDATCPPVARAGD